jgi:molybdopterin biosynthesis enzyme MoaB
MRAAVLTFSSSVARETREDRSGDALARLAADAGGEPRARCCSEAMNTLVSIT